MSVRNGPYPSTFQDATPDVSKAFCASTPGCADTAAPSASYMSLFPYDLTAPIDFKQELGKMRTTRSSSHPCAPPILLTEAAGSSKELEDIRPTQRLSRRSAANAIALLKEVTQSGRRTSAAKQEAPAAPLSIGEASPKQKATAKRRSASSKWSRGIIPKKAGRKRPKAALKIEAPSTTKAETAPSVAWPARIPNDAEQQMAGSSPATPVQHTEEKRVSFELAVQTVQEPAVVEARSVEQLTKPSGVAIEAPSSPAQRSSTSMLGESPTLEVPIIQGASETVIEEDVPDSIQEEQPYCTAPSVIEGQASPRLTFEEAEVPSESQERACESHKRSHEDAEIEKLHSTEDATSQAFEERSSSVQHPAAFMPKEPSHASYASQALLVPVNEEEPDLDQTTRKFETPSQAWNQAIECPDNLSTSTELKGLPTSASTAGQVLYPAQERLPRTAESSCMDAQVLAAMEPVLLSALPQEHFEVSDNVSAMVDNTQVMETRSNTEGLAAPNDQLQSLETALKTPSNKTSATSEAPRVDFETQEQTTTIPELKIPAELEKELQANADRFASLASIEALADHAVDLQTRCQASSLEKLELAPDMLANPATSSSAAPDASSEEAPIIIISNTATQSETEVSTQLCNTTCAYEDAQSNDSSDSASETGSRTSSIAPDDTVKLDLVDAAAKKPLPQPVTLAAERVETAGTKRAPESTLATELEAAAQLADAFFVGPSQLSPKPQPVVKPQMVPGRAAIRWEVAKGGLFSVGTAASTSSAVSSTVVGGSAKRSLPWNRPTPITRSSATSTSRESTHGPIIAMAGFERDGYLIVDTSPGLLAKSTQSTDKNKLQTVNAAANNSDSDDEYAFSDPRDVQEERARKQPRRQSSRGRYQAPIRRGPGRPRKTVERNDEDRPFHFKNYLLNKPKTSYSLRPRPSQGASTHSNAFSALAANGGPFTRESQVLVGDSDSDVCSVSTSGACRSFPDEAEDSDGFETSQRSDTSDLPLADLEHRGRRIAPGSAAVKRGRVSIEHSDLVSLYNASYEREHPAASRVLASQHRPARGEDASQVTPTGTCSSSFSNSTYIAEPCLPREAGRAHLWNGVEQDRELIAGLLGSQLSTLSIVKCANDRLKTASKALGRSSLGLDFRFESYLKFLEEAVSMLRSSEAGKESRPVSEHADSGHPMPESSAGPGLERVRQRLLDPSAKNFAHAGRSSTLRSRASQSDVATASVDIARAISSQARAPTSRREDARRVHSLSEWESYAPAPPLGVTPLMRTLDCLSSQTDSPSGSSSRQRQDWAYTLSRSESTRKRKRNSQVRL